MRHLVLVAILVSSGACAPSSARPTVAAGPPEGLAAETAAQEGEGAAEAHAGHEVPVSPGEDLGEVRFSTSCDPAVQEDFDRAVALLHHMMYTQARQQFEAVAEADPDCAMAGWGVAMSLFHPLWPDTPSREDLIRGERALERAEELGPETERERAYVDAAQAFYRDWQQVGEEQRLARFEEAMGRLHRAHPDDLDGAAFYALSMLATAPAGDETLEKQRRAAAMLRDLHETAPRHPGAIHYGIHAHDFPGLASEGRHLADAYHRIAPNVPHALHMPSHIYVRLGEWQPNIEWNLRSAEAALRYPENGATSLHYVHALDYLVYGYLQQLEDQRARRVIEDIESRDRYQDSPITGYNMAAIYARYALERRDWEGAKALTAESLGRTGIEWSERPESLAVLAHARGLGAARRGDVAAAESALRELERLGRTLEEASEGSPGLAYWAQRARVQRDTVAAWTAHARGDRDRAVALMTRAADLEDEIGKNPVMPGFVLPARELLGDLLLEHDEPAAALAAYEASLEDAPRRANSLYGAGEAAERLGRRDDALRYYGALIDLAGDGAGRPILTEARRYVEENRR